MTYEDYLLIECGHRRVFHRNYTTQLLLEPAFQIPLDYVITSGLQCRLNPLLGVVYRS